MVHRPNRSSVFGNRKLGDLTDREAPRKAVGNQNLSPGRYDVNEEAKKGTQRVLQKTQQIKTGKTLTGQAADPVVLDPVKSISSVQTNN